MPDRLISARNNAPSLLTLLNEVRNAKPDLRDFAWFDRRDPLMKAGVPPRARGQISTLETMPPWSARSPTRERRAASGERR